MASNDAVSGNAASIPQPEFVYRISPDDEWSAAQATGRFVGGDFDRQSGFIHLSTADQVTGTLQMFFPGREDLYLLQIRASELGPGLVYEAVPDLGLFPHYYGNRSAEKDSEQQAPGKDLDPLPLAAVVNSVKLEVKEGVHLLPRFLV
eukprot:TRINITY_DN9834_c0_g1_i1.p1 TRINITY_DN9834_c0_g1~~TRINITY_DN9834_c0_g1_i1.p1  ORF type:complete len:148 (-),score=9.74 TRINITY_DN9834_c0_g1_i1:21-464(-)